MIYFDNAATTYPKPEEVYKALDFAQRNLSYNAGRGHYLNANRSHDLIEETRKKLCKYAHADNLVFTPSATYALNQIIAGLEFNRNDIVYCSPYDHNAIARTLYAYSKKYEFILKTIPLCEDYTIDTKKFEFLCMKDKPKAIFCTHVSNVTGLILPIHDLGVIAQKINSTFIVDGAQAFGLVDINFDAEPLDYYVFAGHKTLYGPFGVGGYFYKVNNLKLSIFGGTGSDSLNLEMPYKGNQRFEPSSMNVAAINGINAAIDWVTKNDVLSHECALRNYAIKKLSEIDGIVLYDTVGDNVGILSFNLNGFESENLAQILADDFNICVRGGYHCAPFIHEYLNTKDFLGTVRISFSFFNSLNEIDCLINALDEISLE